MRPNLRETVAAVALAAAVAAATARAEDPVDTVDYELRARDRVLGTVRPENERESYYVRGLRGTKVTATVRRQGATTLLPALELVDDALASLATGTPTRTGARLRGATFSESAPVRFRVTGSGGDGDYRLDLSLRPQTVWREASESDQEPGDAGDVLVAFAAPAGSTAVVDFRAARGSAHRPQVVERIEPGGGVVVVTPPNEGATTHHAVLQVLLSGETQLRLRNVGAAAGGWSLTVRLRGTRATRTVTDLTDEALAGEFAGVQAVVARLADPTTATLLDPLDGLNLDGVSMSIPAGAVALPTVISLYESEAFFAGDGIYDAGTTLTFSPSGTEFGEPLTVTVPYDTDAFDPDTADDPETGIVIAVQDAETGEIETISPTSVDEDAATCSFPVSHFSLFQPASRQPRPLRGDFTELEVGAAALPGYGAAITFGRNGLLVADRQLTRATGVGARTLRRTTVGWFLDAGGAPRLAASSTVAAGLLVNANVVDDETVQLAAQDQDPDVGALLLRGRGGDVLAAVEEHPNLDGGRLHLLVRKARGTPTAANLAGGWHLRVLHVEARQQTGRVAVEIASVDADLDVDLKGRAVVADSLTRRMSQVFPQSRWQPSKSAVRPAPGNLTAGTTGIATLDLDFGGTPSLSTVTPLGPLLGGRLLAGSASFVDDEQAPTEAAFRVVVLVRRSARAGIDSLAANALFSSLRIEPEDVAAAPFPLRILGQAGRLAVSENGVSTLTALQTVAGHDSRGDPVLTTRPIQARATATVAPDGTVHFTGPLPRGVLAPGGAALLLFDAEPGGIEVGQSLPARPPQ